MANPEDRLSDDELHNLKEEVSRIFEELQSRREAIEFFFENPLAFLRNFNITVMRYIRNNVNLRNRLVETIREITGSLNKIVNSCLKCKLAAMFIMLGSIGKAHLVWSGFMEVVDNIYDAIRRYFEHTSEQLDRLLHGVEIGIDRLRPSHIAELICRQLGYCKG